MFVPKTVTRAPDTKHGLFLRLPLSPFFRDFRKQRIHSPDVCAEERSAF